jgi:aldehyde:ferredoxin oxidoreductase
MNLFGDGIITSKDTDGIALNFGDVDAMIEMVRKTAEGEGFGQKLALGSYHMAESYGHPEYSMTCKKQEMPAYDPRAIQGIGLNFATGNRGGCHVRGYTISPEVLGQPVKMDPRATEGKPALDITFQDLTAALDSSGMCLFSTFGIGAEDIAELLSAATGVTFTTEEFMKIGTRIWNLERLFNLKAGFTTADDKLPERLTKDPILTGPSKGLVNRIGEMLPEYYKLRGWDTAGVPTKNTLADLGL